MVYRQCNKLTQPIDHHCYGFHLQCTNILQLGGRLEFLVRILRDLHILFLQAQTSYSWVVEVRPDQRNSGTQNIVLKINEGSKVVVDETISDIGGLASGRLGVY